MRGVARAGEAAAVIGAGGYLGRHLLHVLERQGIAASGYGLTDTESGSPEIQQLDVTCRDHFDRLDPGLSRIFFFAGLTGTDQGFRDYERFLRVNELGLLNLLSWMVESGCRARLIFPSSRLVYRGTAGSLLPEEAAKEAKTLYAVNKLAGEAMLQAYANAFGIDYTVFRICVPYGDLFDQGYSYGTVGFFLQRARQGEAITLYGDGEVRRTFTHVEDICTRMIAACGMPESAGVTLNIGGENLSLREAAAAVAERFGVGLRFVPWPAMAERLESGDTVFDSTRLDTLLNLPYHHDFLTWVQRL